MRRLAATWAASIALLAGGGCSDGPRDRVEDYLGQANEAQAPAPAIKRATSIYRRVATGDVEITRAAERIEQAERAIGEVLGELEDIDPPAEAAQLHARLLRVFRLNAAMARETTLFARFLPRADQAVKPLNEANSRMSAGLESGEGPTQARALDRFATTLKTVLGRLRKLEPPQVMARIHRQRINQLSAVRSLALRLRDALRRQDAVAVADLLTRFVEEASQQPTPGLDPGSVRRYRQRYRELVEATRDVRREESRVRRIIILED